MTASPTPAPALTPRAAIALERAERRREMLEYMADWGMSLTKDICTRAMDAPYQTELKHCPGRAFAASSRAVRLTLAMEARVEEYILAVCNGEAATPARSSIANPALSSADGAAGSPGAAAPDRDLEDRDEGSDEVRDEAGEAARESIEREIGDVDESRSLPRSVRQRLIEGEDFADIVAGESDDGIAAIRAELGLDPLPFFHNAGRAGTSGPSPAPEACPQTPPWTSLKFRLAPSHEDEGRSEVHRASG